MNNISKHSFSYKPSGISSTPLTETINGETKTIAFCTSKKMAKDLISRFMLIDSYQYELEYLLEANLPIDQIRDHIKTRLNTPPDVK